MMKIKKLIIVFGAGFVLLAGGLYFGRDYLVNNESFRLLIKEEAGEKFGEKLNFDNLETHFGHIGITNLAYSLNDGSDSLFIKELEIGWSLFDLLKNRFKPTKGVTWIKLDGLRLVIGNDFNSNNGYGEQNFQNKRDQLLAQIEKTYKDVIANFKSLKNIEIENGAIDLSNRPENSITLLSNVSGEFITEDHRSAKINMRAKTLKSSRYDFSVDAVLDISDFTFDSNISLNNFEFANALPEKVLPWITFSEGRFDSNISFKKFRNAESAAGYSFTGTFEVKNALYGLKKHAIKGVNAHARGLINNNNIIIEEFEQKIDGAVFNSTGKVKVFPDALMELKTDFTGLNTALILSLFDSTKTKDFEAVVAGNMDITGGISNPVIKGNFNTEKISLMNRDLLNSSAQFEIDPNSLNISNLVSHYKDTKINLTANAQLPHLDSLKIVGTFEGNLLSVQDYVQFPKENKYNGMLEFNLFGDAKNLDGSGTLMMVSSNTKGDITFEADLGLNNGDVTFSGRTTEGELTYKGFYKSDGSSVRVDVQNALTALVHDWDIPVETFIKENTVLNMLVEGQNNNTKILVHALSAKLDTLFAFKADYMQGVRDRAFLKSEVVIPANNQRKFKVLADLSRDGDKYFVDNIFSPDLFRGSGELINNGSLDIKGTLNINTDISHIKSFFDFGLVNGGVVFGEVQLSGSTDNPNILGKLSLNNGTIKSLSGLKGNFGFSANDWLTYDLENISISNDTKEFFKAEGNVDFNKKTGNLKITGKDLPQEIYGSFLGTDEKLLRGNATYDLTYVKSENNAFVAGKLSILEGNVSRFNFKNLELNLGAPENVPTNVSAAANNYSSFFPSGIWVEELAFNTDKGINVKGAGFLSASNQFESDFKIDMDGDLLSVLRDLDSYFLKTSSDGQAFVALEGNLKNPVVSEGQLTIKNGLMELESVFNKVRNIDLSLTLEKESRFIEIQNLTASLDGKYASLSNKAADSFTENGTEYALEPLELMSDGLNLGILEIFTGKDGVDLHIKELMEPKSRGTVKVSGKNSDESFFLAGPVENPKIRGNFYLKDTRIDYPKAITESDGVVRRFLRRADWDVRVIPEENNHYTRVEPNSLVPFIKEIAGDVFVNIKIDDEADGLTFRGVINDYEEGGFLITGDLISSRGNVETLDFNFKVQDFKLEFAQGKPIISGKAKTTVRDRGTSSSSIDNITPAQPTVDIYVILVSDEKDADGNRTGRVIEQGTWDEDYLPDFYYIFSGEPSVANSPFLAGNDKFNDSSLDSYFYNNEYILSLLGISVENFKDKAASMMIGRAEQMIFNPLLRPVERKLRRALNLDELRFKPNIASGFSYGSDDPRLLYNDVGDYNKLTDPKYLFATPKFTLGKYIWDDVYVSYDGQLLRGIQEDEKDEMGLSHVLGLEYRLKDKLYFQLEWDYDFYRFQNKNDTRFWFRHQIQLKGIKN